MLLQACSETTKSPDDEIRDFVQSSVEAAENRDLEMPSDSSMSAPLGVFFNGFELLVADGGNDRVLVFR